MMPSYKIWEWLKLKDTSMGGDQIELVLLITYLPLSPHSYGRPSPSNPWTIYDGTFVQATTPLEDEDENKAIATWIYREKDTSKQDTSPHEINTEYYGKGLHLMKCFSYKGNNPIGVNSKGLLKPIEAVGRHKWDTIGLGFKKIPFHLGINQFVPELDYQLELENNNISESPKYDSDEDSLPCPIPPNLEALFAEPNDFVPWVSMVDWQWF